MNVSTLQLHLEISIKILDKDPDVQDHYSTELPTLTRETVLQQLGKLPAIGWVKSFHRANETADATDGEGRQLRAHCKVAGRRLVKAYEEVNRLRRDVLSSREFIPHPSEFKTAARHIRESLWIWEQGSRRGLFRKENALSRDVRFRYTELSLPLAVVVARLTLPADYEPWLEEWEEVLDRRDLRRMFRYDSWASYGASLAKPDPRHGGSTPRSAGGGVALCADRERPSPRVHDSRRENRPAAHRRVQS